MNERLCALIKFCFQYESVICYGASEHGYAVKQFLEKNGIKVIAFMISDEVRKNEMRDGIPICSVNRVESFPCNVGIVLSLFERHHPYVLEMLRVYGKTKGIYALSDTDQWRIRMQLVIYERNESLFNSYTNLSENEMTIFHSRAIELFKKYSRINCKFIGMWRLSGCMMWIYYLYRDKFIDNDEFYLYYPITHAHHPEEKLIGANGFLLNKLSIDGAEVLTRKKLRFWQYVFQNFKDKCYIDDNYVHLDWTEEFCKVYNSLPIFYNYIHFTMSENEIGIQFLQQHNLQKEYICISSRDSEYLRISMRDNVGVDFRDKYRNSDICCYDLCVDYMEKLKIRTVRMGAAVEKKYERRNVFDYAVKYRNDFLDVFLVSKCKFFVSDLSGIQTFAVLMAKPMVILNASLLTTRNEGATFYAPEKDIAILKKLWDSQNNRFISIREMLNYEINICVQELNIGGAVYSEYQRRGIVPVDNTPEEILSVVKEMNERIEGTFKYDALDIELQEKYREIVDNYPMRDNVLNNWRLGAAFLRENQWLLD